MRLARAVITGAEGGGPVETSVVVRTADDGVPWVFVTGYDDWALPDAYRDVPRLAKPFAMGAVVDSVAKLVAPGAAT